MSGCKVDLIKTIEDDDENVPDYSENSDEEEEFQPTKQKRKKNKDFDSSFQFVSNVDEYNEDVWNDVAKYIKRKAKSKVDDKILEARRNRIKKESDPENATEVPEEEVHTLDSGDDLSLSEDELQKDSIRVKEKAGNKKKNIDEVGEDEFFEDAPPFEENVNFYQMNLSRPLLKAVTAMNFVHPTPIQAATIPIALQGRDICGCAATGTGKTAAYMLPTLERLLYRPVGAAAQCRVLVLVPTRELGVQVYQVTKQLAQFTTVEVGLSVGGLDLKAQENILRKNPDIVIATPGRLIDHLKNTPSFSLDSIEVLVLDEADRMLDEHFAEQMKEIIRQCSRTRQTLLFSATMTEEVKDLVSVSLNKPVKLFVDNNQDVAFNLRQEFIRIRKGHEGDREAILAALVCRTFRDHAMVFVQTKKQAHRLHILLGLLGIKVGELHGDLTQPQRLEALRKFKDEEIDVLIATDVAARGLDIRGVKTVINFLMPATLEHYIHRVGRTARAGRSGVSVSLAGDAEYKVVKAVIKNARNPPKSRIIPPEIVAKYRKRVSDTEEDVKRILQEEWEERTLQRAENQLNKAQNLLKGEQKLSDRSWFQSAAERRKEKEKFRLTTPDKPEKKTNKEKVPINQVVEKKEKKKKNLKGKHGDTAEDRVQAELQKVMALQARLSKKNRKPHKIKAVSEGADFMKSQKSRKRKQSSFDTDLTEVSKKGAKRLRYEANVKQKFDKLVKKKPSMANKFSQLHGKSKLPNKNKQRKK